MIWTDRELYARALATLLACWEEIARGSPHAKVEHRGGIAVAVFPCGPERTVYNNAVFDRGLGVSERRAALDAMEAEYATAEIDDFAAWVHESDADMARALVGRGYSLAESTRAMGRSIDDLPDTLPAFDIAPSDLCEHVEIIGVPGLLKGVDPRPFHVVVARLANERVATAMAFDHAGDCGVFNVGTLAPFRGRGIATAVTNVLLHEAAVRGCATASLQATEMAEGVYAAAGFRDLGRILEYVRAPRTDEGGRREPGEEAHS